jgi:RNA polymerase sigma-70 factor, ECF subfamily
MSSKEKFMKLYEPNHKRLCSYVQALVHNREEARDIISEVTLIALEKFETGIDSEKFVYYLFGIARNLFLKKLNDDKRSSASLFDTNYSNESAEGKVWKYELTRILNLLNPVDRNRLVLFEISGFSYKEIAAITGESEQKVKASLYQTRQYLKSFAEKENHQLTKIQKA